MSSQESFDFKAYINIGTLASEAKYVYRYQVKLKYMYTQQFASLFFINVISILFTVAFPFDIWP